MDKVSAIAVEQYEIKAIRGAVDRHFDLLNLSMLVEGKKSVLLKPNLLMKRKPHEATTTHPIVMLAIAEKLIDLGIKQITIADSPGGPYTQGQLSAIYDASGMSEVAKAHPDIIKLNMDTSYESCTFLDGKVAKKFNIISPINNAELVINVCKLKTHGMTGMSGAVKNMFGSVPGLQKPELHYRFPQLEMFCEMLIDLCLYTKPAITFVDAIESMEGDGPSGGSIRKTDLLFCGTNPFALDVVLCDYIQMSDKFVPTVTSSIARGLTTPNAKDITMLGDTITTQDFQKPKGKSLDFSNFVPKPLRRYVEKVAVMASPKPIIVLKGCIGCGKCAESCPAKTIEIRDKKAVIDYSKCIKCFCCHEMCPVKTIAIKRFKLFSH